MAEKRPKMKRPATVGDLMSQIFHGTRTEQRLKEGKIWLIWEQTVGDQIAVRARPVRFLDGVLTVAVSSAPWMQQLNFLKKEIVTKLNKRLGADLVRDIYLKAGSPDKTITPVPDPPRRERPLTEDEQRRIAERTAAAGDPELQAALARLISRHLSQDTSK